MEVVSKIIVHFNKKKSTRKTAVEHTRLTHKTLPFLFFNWTHTTLYRSNSFYSKILWVERRAYIKLRTQKKYQRKKLKKTKFYIINVCTSHQSRYNVSVSMQPIMFTRSSTLIPCSAALNLCTLFKYFRPLNHLS